MTATAHFLLAALLVLGCSGSNPAIDAGPDAPASCSSSTECAAPTAVCDTTDGEFVNNRDAVHR